MKRSFHTGKPARFDGNLRHYHRKVSKPKTGWDEWVTGRGPSKKRNWMIISLITGGIIALLAIVAGLINELS